MFAGKFTAPPRRTRRRPRLSPIAATPGYEEPEMARRIASLMLLAGAVTVLVILQAPDVDPSDHDGFRVIAILAALGAAVIWFGRLEGLAASLVGVVYGIGLVSAAVYVAKPISGTSSFYLWPLLFGAYFLRWRWVVGIVALAWASFAGALTLRPDIEMRAILFVDTVVTVSVAVAVVVYLRERVAELVGHLRRSAITDPLTGLVNRRGFEEALERELARAQRSGAPVALVVFDLDHFKQLNDTLGHAAGDRALVQFARLLRRSARRGDVLARIGGEEFAAVLYDADANDALTFAERVVARQRQLDHGTPLTVSAGVAVGRSPYPTRDEIFDAADRALYAAKRAGRARARLGEVPARATVATGGPA